MLFNSFEFCVFLPVVFILYWFVLHRSLTIQNLLLLIASYVFYGWWDWRFLSLIIISSFIDFFAGLAIKSSKYRTHARWWMGISLVANLGMLGVFKYYNFFVDSFVQSFSGLGFELNARTLSIVLPVGISFYTFQTLSYTIDVYRGKIEPTRNILAFFAFVSFFPQLVAGPIERASNLLPQFFQKREFTYSNGKRGIQQILWGLFKKVVVADNCAVMVDQIFDNHETMPPSALFLGAVYFAFQIYGDFSGYSDIAIGTARLFGFKLMTNFRYPYFSRDIAEFWRRWHISLSTWFRDYVYIPIGGSKGTKSRTILNVLVVFLVSGFWHGANWTFIVWGLVNGLLFLPLLVFNWHRQNMDVAGQDGALPSVREGFAILVTFAVTCLAWIFFRADNLPQAIDYIGHMFDWSNEKSSRSFIAFLPVIGLMLCFEWVERRREFPAFRFRYPVFNLTAYFILAYTITVMARSSQPFIYFQF